MTDMMSDLKVTEALKLTSHNMLLAFADFPLVKTSLIYKLISEVLILRTISI